MRGVFLDAATVDQGDLDLSGLRETLPEWMFHDDTRTGDIADRIANAHIVISNKVVLDRDAITSAARLKLICIAATGTNNVDLQCAMENDVVVSNARAYATPSVVDHVFAMILMLARNLHRYQTAVQQKKWQSSSGFCLLDYPIRELAGQTLGIIGYGELGRGVARVARSFGMQVLVARRSRTTPQPGRVSMDQLLARSDVISLHCPLTQDTRGLIGASELSQMKPGAVLINTARGGIVDEIALVHALQNGIIAGAAVDVLEQEPPGEGHHLLDIELDNLIVTPHIAWGSRESRQRLIDDVVMNIRAFLTGTPRNVVNSNDLPG